MNHFEKPAPLQITGEKEVLLALERMEKGVEEVFMILIETNFLMSKIREKAINLQIPILEISQTDINRMRVKKEPLSHVLALIGRDPFITSVTELLSLSGPIWFLVNVSYVSNIGLCVRTAEASGAAGILTYPPLSNQKRRSVNHFSMGADRFLPILSVSNVSTFFEKCRLANRPIYALETSGNILLNEIKSVNEGVWIVGNELEGIPEEILSQCDSIVRLPFGGFVPSYNLQTAMSAVALENLHRDLIHRSI